MSFTGEVPFKFTDFLDPAHFHCVRYIGPPPSKSPNFTKSSSVYFLFQATGGHRQFVAPLAWTWDESQAAQLLLPLWMKNDYFDYGTGGIASMKFTDNFTVNEFTGTLRLEPFTGLQDSNLPFELILPELLGSMRPLCNGTVLPLCFAGQRILLRAFAEGMEDGRVFWFNLEKGALDLRTSAATENLSARHLKEILLNGSWSEEFKVFKYHLNNQTPEKQQIFLVCNVPTPLQVDLLKCLGVKFEEVDVSSFVPEEHLQIYEDEDLEDEDEKNLVYRLITDVDKISPALMSELLVRIKSKNCKLILTTSTRSIESSPQLIQLEKSAHRFNFEFNCFSFPMPSEAERFEIIRRECLGDKKEDFDFSVKDYKWAVSSMNYNDLMRLGRIFGSLNDETERAFKLAIQMIKEDEAAASDSALFTILSGKTGNFEFYGYRALQDELENLIKGPLVNSEAYDRFGLPKSSGFLLHGPPGCGKTTLFLKLLTSPPFRTLFTVFHVPSASHLLSKYFGETEANIRRLFAQARERKPAIIFIDQIETLGRKRGLDSSNSTSSSDANDRYLSTLLNEMDGISGNEGISVLACANHIEFLDEALLRPGRLDRHFFLSLPDLESRREIFEGFTGGNFEDEEILKESEGWSGAEIKQFCKELLR